MIVRVQRYSTFPMCAPRLRICCLRRTAFACLATRQTRCTPCSAQPSLPLVCDLTTSPRCLEKTLEPRQRPPSRHRRRARGAMAHHSRLALWQAARLLPRRPPSPLAPGWPQARRHTRLAALEHQLREQHICAHCTACAQSAAWPCHVARRRMHARGTRGRARWSGGSKHAARQEQRAREESSSTQATRDVPWSRRTFFLPNSPGVRRLRRNRRLLPRGAGNFRGGWMTGGR